MTTIRPLKVCSDCESDTNDGTRYGLDPQFKIEIWDAKKYGELLGQSDRTMR